MGFLVCFIENPNLQCLVFAAVLILCSANSSGILAGPLDLVGETHVGTVMAISNVMASVPGVIGVRVAAYLQESVGWSGVFVSCGGLYLLSFVVYLKWGSVKRI